MGAHSLLSKIVESSGIDMWCLRILIPFYVDRIGCLFSNVVNLYFLIQCICLSTVYGSIQQKYKMI